MASTLSGERLRGLIAACRVKCDALEPSELAKLDAGMAVDFGEHFEYQETQALAHASGRLETDAAAVVYGALGEVGSSANGGWAAGTDTAAKVIVTQLVGELLRLRIAGRLAPAAA